MENAFFESNQCVFKSGIYEIMKIFFIKNSFNFFLYFFNHFLSCFFFFTPVRSLFKNQSRSFSFYEKKTYELCVWLRVLICLISRHVANIRFFFGFFPTELQQQTIVVGEQEEEIPVQFITIEPEMMVMEEEKVKQQKVGKKIKKSKQPKEEESKPLEEETPGIGI